MVQKGSILPLILILLVCLGAALYVLKPNTANIDLIPKQTPSEKIYSDKEIGFRFKYPALFEVISDSEENYFKITQTDHRKNFTGYVGYKPPEFVTGLILKKEAETPLVLWIFDNPDNLSIDNWFDKYWYYPFVWGVFSYPEKNPLRPIIEATISGQIAKSVVVSYQPGKPEFIYIAKEGKMFMFKLIKELNEKVITQILASFKFTQ